jgi:hypothetical protein
LVLEPRERIVRRETGKRSPEKMAPAGVLCGKLGEFPACMRQITPAAARQAYLFKKPGAFLNNHDGDIVVARPTLKGRKYPGCSSSNNDNAHTVLPATILLAKIPTTVWKSRQYRPLHQFK